LREKAKKFPFLSEFMLLDDKVAIVTGGGRGIGKAIAVELAKNGADIVIASRDKKEMNSAAKEITALGRKALTVKTDVTKLTNIKNMVKKTVKELGKIDILVNNAGILFHGPFEEIKHEQIDATVNVNLVGLMHVTREVISELKKQKEGLIINISSVAGKEGYVDLAVYSATKFGVIGFTESLAGELEDENIRVYAICPTATQTKMWEQISDQPAAHVPEDVALEIIHLIKNRKKIAPGSAINVKKHL